MTKNEIIKLALEALKKTHYRMIDAGLLDQQLLNDNFTVAEALREALEQPEQEPMRLYVEEFARRCGWEKDSGEGAFEYVQRKSYAQGLEDATPPAAQRPWVGLEPKEILDLFDVNNVYGSKWIEFARAVEAKLKGQNYD